MTSPARTLGDRLVLLLATGAGLGYIPVAPGTFGSAGGLALVWCVQLSNPPWFALVTVAVAVFLIGIPICTQAAKLLERKDPGQVVFDEIAAFPWIYLFIPLTVTSSVAGFLFFRVFDILKPWPIRRFERLPEGLGIMADDAIAAVYAAIATWATVSLVEVWQ